MAKKKVRIYFNPLASPPKFSRPEEIAAHLDIPISEIDIINVASNQSEMEFIKRIKYRKAVKRAFDLYNSGKIENLQIVPATGNYHSSSDRVTRDKEVAKNLPKIDGKVNLKWNHDCVKFPEAIAYAREKGRLDTSLGENATDIQVYQLDTGWTNHNAIEWYPRYNTQDSVSFIERDKIKTGEDRVRAHNLVGNLQTKAHGTSTGHTFIGRKAEPLEEGFPENFHGLYKGHYNEGLFPFISFTPLRIARRVVFNLNFGEKAAKDMLEGVKYAVNKGAQVITMSMGGELINPAYPKAAEYAHKRGVIFVCAAGNSRIADLLVDVVRPAEESGTIAAAGITPNAGHYIPWPEGCDGEEVDISAPAAFIYTALKNGKNPEDDQYKFGHGTSQATVHVAAAAALYLHFYKEELDDSWFKNKPSRIVECFRWAIRKSANKPTHWSKMDIADNKGILDVYNLLQNAYSPEAYRAIS